MALFIKLWLLFKAIPMFYFASEYKLKLESCYYSHIKKSYLLVFRVRGKQIFKIIDVEQACLDKNLLAMIHPIDSYIAGIIYGIHRSKSYT
jgi:hypothetical protein